MAESRWILLGTVGKPLGLRGAFFVSGRSDPIPERCKQVFIGPTAEVEGTSFFLSSYRDPQKRPVISLEEVQDRTSVERMRGSSIWMLREELDLDESSEFLWADIIGAEVFDVEGVLMGSIVDMANYGASDIAVIEHPDLGRVEIPFVDVYVDMTFRAPVSRVDLIVASSVFADFWVKA